MKKKNGFTLIELLAVIVILAIIALIATPIVLNLINQTRKGAAARSAEGIRKSAQTYYYSQIVENPIQNMTTKTYDFSTTGEGGYNGEFNFDGKRPSAGTVTIAADGKVTGEGLVIDGYTCGFNDNGSATCEKGNGSSSNNNEQNNEQQGEEQQAENINYLYTYNYVQDYPPSNASYNASFDPSSETSILTYLRYPLNDEDNIPSGALPETCLKKDGFGELCLSYNQESTSITKVKEYFKWDDLTSSSEYEGVECKTIAYTGNPAFYCGPDDDSELDIGVEVFSNGDVMTYAYYLAGTYVCGFDENEGIPFCIDI